MRLRVRVRTLDYAKPAGAPPLLSPGALLVTALAVTFWLGVSAVGAACISIGTLLLWAWAGTQRSLHLDLNLLVAIGCVTVGGTVLFRFSVTTIRDLLRPRQ